MSASLQIINADSRRLSVRLVRIGSDEPHIEFFDASSPQEDAYFTGVRCSVGTLFASAFEDGSPADVLFNEDLPMWGISSENITAIQTWLKSHLNQEELLEFPDLQEEQRKLPPPHAAEMPKTTNTTPAFELESTSIQEVLHQILALLNQAEHMETRWRQGEVQACLHLLAAKQETLRALASLKIEDEP